MKWTDRIRQVKIVLVVIAILMAVASVMVSHRLTRDLEAEERNKMGVWAEAMRSLNTADENTDLNLVLRVIDENHTIPVIVLNQQGRVQTVRNVDTGRRHDADSTAYVAQMASRLKAGGHYIRIYLDEDHADGYIDVCYDDSLTLKRLAVYPYIQIGAVLLFVGVAVIALLTSKRAEQNRVWVGLSKETAHQLGTPISSLMAWVEILRENYPDDDLIPEMDKDVKRLQLIADRFSKIGSLPEPVPVSLDTTLSHVVDYMDRRTSRRVVISVSHTQGDQTVNLNASLFEWVIENLCKNAVDAMGGDGGKITITTGTSPKGVWIEVADTGKGIPKKRCGQRVPPRIYHQAPRMGSGSLARQAHRRGIPPRPHLCQEFRARRGHCVPHRAATALSKSRRSPPRLCPRCAPCPLSCPFAPARCGFGLIPLFFSVFAFPQVYFLLPLSVETLLV